MNEHAQPQSVIIAGGGPAGLTAAYELATRSDGRFHPVVLEASDMLGGISRTVSHNGNRMDIGGHRFFSKDPRVTELWARLMPAQSAPAKDEILIGQRMTGSPDAMAAGADEGNPEKKDRVWLKRRRVSRIYYLRRFFDYPVTLSMRTLRALGLGRTLKAGFGYLGATLHKRPETSLENFYINRFGRPLYSMFFEDYTEKVWGVHPSQLGADWGSQRVKGLSVLAILRDMLMKSLGTKGKSGKVETSLIEEFIYPKYGPGQLWETVGAEAAEAGADIRMQTKVEEVNVENGRVVSVTVTGPDGSRDTIPCDAFMSSMPIKDLVASLRGIEVPEDVKEIAATLPYRDFITVGLLVDKMKIKNQTKLRTYADRVPDTWIYVQERDVRMGRIQVFNNWSPYMVNDYENKLWIGLEYFSTEGDEMWRMSDEEFIAMAKRELASIGIIDEKDVEDAVRIRVKKAYPSYYGSYYRLDEVRRFLDTIPNLYCIGRNGQHRYNNMDHSMLTAMTAADLLLEEKATGATGATDATGKGAGTPLADKTRLWQVNTDQSYHESKS